MTKRALSLVACAFAALAWTFAPSLQAAIESAKVSSATNSFAADLQLARTEAVRRGASIVLCKSGDGVFCAASGSWAQGWLIYDDANANGLREIGEHIIAREQALSSSLRFTGTLDAVRSVAFGPTGTARLVDAGPEASLVVCRHAFQAGEARRITLRAGRELRVQRAVVSGCA